MIFQFVASTITNSAPNVDANTTSSRSSLLNIVFEKPTTLPIDFVFFNSSIVLQIIISASLDSKIVLNPVSGTNFGSILRIRTSLSSDRKLPNFDLATAGFRIMSLAFISVKIQDSLLRSFPSYNDFIQRANHCGRIRVLKYISTKCNSTGSSLHCTSTHFKNLLISIGLRPTCYHNRDRATFYNLSKGTDISSIKCFNQIGTSFCPNSCCMSNNLRIVRIFDIFSSWIHHCHKWHTPLIAFI